MPTETAVTPEAILSECPRLGLDDKFAFRCGPDRACFGSCCHDVSIVLTPYDVLRLKRAAGMESTEFLEEHTMTLGAGQKFPVIILKMQGEDKHCPFLSEQGCRVYNDRPWACRMYPLGSAAPKSPTPEQQPFHFVIREDRCHGHGGETMISVRDWAASQGAEAFEMMSAGFKELILHDFWEKDRPLSEQQAAMFYMACYDLDRFRRFVFETRFLKLLEVDEARVEALREDDLELLDFGIQWLRFAIFNERAMKVRKDGHDS